MRVKLNAIYRWRTFHTGYYTVHWVGNNDFYLQLCQRLHCDANLDSSLMDLLKSAIGNYAGIIEGPDFIFACVDRIRSYPVFYVNNNHSLWISNCAQTIKIYGKLNNINSHALLEFKMSGYVMGHDTLYQHLYQLQAGECLLWKKNKTLTVRRYYCYIPYPQNNISKEDRVEALGSVVNKVINRILDEANGDPIWIPLSGGFDSRLILAKLVEMKYDAIQTFSFGLPGNHEAKMAEHIARLLNVSWFLVPFRAKTMKDSYYRKVRREYAAFAAGLCSTPSYLGFYDFYWLVCEKRIPHNAIIINGQSGDFITGGHLPLALFENTHFEKMISLLIKKHCSLWGNLNKPDNVSLLLEKINAQFPFPRRDSMTMDHIMSDYESWEFQERQTKLVINGQRIYDYFRLRWALPFWENEMLDFWSQIPFHLKKSQHLYVSYLKKYNYCGVYDALRAVVNPWIFRYTWIPWIARVLGIFFGAEAKKKYYRRMYYYSCEHSQYAYHGRRHYLSHYCQARNVVSLDANQYLSDLKIEKI